MKVLYVRNLTATLTEEKLRESFEAFGKVDRVKKIKDYAFVHFDDRSQAVAAMNALNGWDIFHVLLNVLKGSNVCKATTLTASGLYP